jgi:murein endopeptidase
VPRVLPPAALVALLVFATTLGADAPRAGDRAAGDGVGWTYRGPALRDEARVSCRNRDSRSPGTWTAGRLEGGVLLPARGKGFVTWSFRKRSRLNARRYRWGTCRVVKLVVDLAADFRRDHPDAPRLLVGDLSKRRGGPVSGHASHQRGLDVDVYYPRRDGRETEPRSVAQIDRGLARELVTRFLKAGAHRVYVGPSTGFDRPGERVDPWPNHDNHLHARFRPRASDRP